MVFLRLLFCFLLRVCICFFKILLVFHFVFIMVFMVCFLIGVLMGSDGSFYLVFVGVCNCVVYFNFIKVLLGLLCFMCLFYWGSEWGPMPGFILFLLSLLFFVMVLLGVLLWVFY